MMSDDDRRLLFRRLCEVEGMERFLRKRFLGKRSAAEIRVHDHSGCIQYAPERRSPSRGGASPAARARNQFDIPICTRV